VEIVAIREQLQSRLDAEERRLMRLERESRWRFREAAAQITSALPLWP
jgi:hypothetical protein